MNYSLHILHAKRSNGADVRVKNVSQTFDLIVTTSAGFLEKLGSLHRESLECSAAARHMPLLTFFLSTGCTPSIWMCMNYAAISHVAEYDEMNMLL